MAEKIILDLEVKTNIDQTTKQVDGLKNSVDNTNTSVKGFKKETDKIDTGGIDKMQGSISSLSPALGRGISGVKALGSQLLILAANPVGAVIMAIVAGLTLLYKAFTSTKDGADKVSQVFSGLSAAVDVVRDRILKAGSAIVKFFSGDFKGALEDGKAAVSGFGDEVASEFKKAADATKQLQIVEDAFNKLSVSRAKVNRDLAAAKELLTDENASYEEKKKALDAIRKAEGEQTKQELDNARSKYNALKDLNALSDTSREDLKKEQDALADLYRLQEQSARDKRTIAKEEKRLESEKAAKQREAAAESKRIADERKREQKELYDNEKQLLQESLKEEGLNFEQRRKLIAENLKLTAEDRKKFNDEINKEEKKSIKEHNDKIDALNKRYDEERENRLADTAVKKEELDYQRKVAEIEGIAQTELEKQTLIEKLDQEHRVRLGLARKMDEDKRALDEEVASAKTIELEKRKTDAKLKALNDLEMIFGAESAMGKAALIGKQLLAAKELLIDLGVMKSKATKAIAGANLDAASSGSAVSSGFAQTLKLGFPAAIPALIGYAASAIGIISAVLSATKKTKSVASSIGGTGGGGSAPSAPSLPAAQPAAFNVVGQGGTNQLAQVIGEQTQQPIQAYVVANDVTSAQSLQRNIQSEAGIGG
jgi:hypothetical protein